MDGYELITCPRCGYKFRPQPGQPPVCPLCSDNWDWWQVIFPALPTGERGEDEALAWGEWLGMLPMPAFVEIAYEGGIQVRLAVPPDKVGEATANAWSALARRRVRLERIPPPEPLEHGWALNSPEKLPSLAFQTLDVLPALLPHLHGGKRLRIWLMGHEEQLQTFLRRMAAYNYSVDSGVSTRTPNLWGLRLTVAKAFLWIGGAMAAVGGGLLALHLYRYAVPMVAAGMLGFVGGVLGMLDFIRWRSIPMEVVEEAINGPLLTVAFSLHTPRKESEPPSLQIFTGRARWMPFDRRTPWPDIKRLGRPLSARQVAMMSFNPS